MRLKRGMSRSLGQSVPRTVLIGRERDIAIVVADNAQSQVFEIVGAVALDAAGLSVGGVPAFRELTVDALTLLRADCVLWASPPPSRAMAREALETAVRARCVVEIVDASESVLIVRPLALEDLFGATHFFEDDAMTRDAFAGKRVLVTGGGGSIGSELVRRFAGLNVGALAALDASEYNLHHLAHDPRLEGVALEVILSDVRDGADVRRVVAQFKPDIIFHAAALKHVPLVERHPCQGVLTNVLGTRNVAEAAREAGANLVFVSTDKAVHPTSVMGETKRLAGLYCRAMDSEANAARAIVVRLGNVLGSAGSAAPLFERQLAHGGPITITDPDAARFFVTVPQSADFLMHAAVVGFAEKAPRGAAYVLEMGDEVPIVELAHDIVHLAGLRPDVDMPIEFVGLRPGEKLRESLVAEEETLSSTPAPRVFGARAGLPALRSLEGSMDQIVALARAGDEAGVRAALRSVAGPGFGAQSAQTRISA